MIYWSLRDTRIYVVTEKSTESISPFRRKFIQRRIRRAEIFAELSDEIQSVDNFSEQFVTAVNS